MSGDTQFLPEAAREASVVATRDATVGSMGLWRILLALATSLLVILSFAGQAASYLGWLALMPLVVALHGASARQGFALVWLAFFVAWFWLGRSIPGAAEAHSGASLSVAWLLLAFLAALHTLPYALCGWLWGWRGWSASLAGLALAAACLTLAACLLPMPMTVNMAHAQFRNTLLIQVLEIGGTPLLLYCYMLVNLSMGQALLRTITSRSLPIRELMIAVSVVGLLVAWGSIRLYGAPTASAETGQDLAVAFVQPNIAEPSASLQEKARSAWSRQAVERLIAQSEDLLRRHEGLQFVQWPEVSALFDFGSPGRNVEALEAFIVRHRTPTLASGSRPITRDPSGEKRSHVNSFLYFAPGSGARLFHDKTVRFPIGEYLPFERYLPFLRVLFPEAGRFQQGLESALFPVAPGVRLGLVVCNEMNYSSSLRAQIDKGANIISNPANDQAWGDGLIPRFNLAQAVFRSVEFRVSIIRAANSGISAAITPAGHLRPGSETRLFEVTAKAVRLPLSSTSSLYYRLGPWFLWLLCAAVAFSPLARGTWCPPNRLKRIGVIVKSASKAVATAEADSRPNSPTVLEAR